MGRKDFVFLAGVMSKIFWQSSASGEIRYAAVLDILIKSLADENPRFREIEFVQEVGRAKQRI